MRDRRLVIHAGFHKSGTTALQEAFDAQSDQLRSAGILYPNIGKIRGSSDSDLLDIKNVKFH